MMQKMNKKQEIRTCLWLFCDRNQSDSLFGVSLPPILISSQTMNFLVSITSTLMVLLVVTVRLYRHDNNDNYMVKNAVSSKWLLTDGAAQYFFSLHLSETMCIECLSCFFLCVYHDFTRNIILNIKFLLRSICINVLEYIMFNTRMFQYSFFAANIFIFLVFVQ